MSPSRDPREWGPYFWSTMHTVAVFYPDHPTSDDMNNARSFFLSLRGLLPCQACADHYSSMLMRNPIENALLSKMELIKWVWQMHEEVNSRTGKRGPAWMQYLDGLNRQERADDRVSMLLIGVVIAALGILITRYIVHRHATGD